MAIAFPVTYPHPLSGTDRAKLVLVGILADPTAAAHGCVEDATGTVYGVNPSTGKRFPLGQADPLYVQGCRQARRDIVAERIPDYGLLPHEHAYAMGYKATYAALAG